MLLVLLTMLLILCLAGLVVAFMVFPRRGVDVPRVPWAAPVLDRAVRSLPTLDRTAESRVGGSHDRGPARVR